MEPLVRIQVRMHIKFEVNILEDEGNNIVKEKINQNISIARVVSGITKVDCVWKEGLKRQF